jgi:acyl-CoA synthetase (AMP-forming)/AMP-acid ligase II
LIESVNEALQEAVRKMSWSADRQVLKIIFLVGDAPPHMDYADGPKYPQICQEAMKKDLIISGGYNVYPKEVEDVLSPIPRLWRHPSSGCRIRNGEK